MNQTELLGKGIYGVIEAARIAGVSAARIRRWVRGYRFTTTRGVHTSPPVWTPQHAPLDGQLSLSFRDLLEVRLVDAFLRRGVSWPTIRKAAHRGQALFHTTHPFSTARFKTDGKALFVEVCDARSEPALIELVQRQHYFTRIVGPYLQGVDFAQDEPVRWWPMGQQKIIVLDPSRAFGQPIVDDRGVPTAVLARAVAATGSVDEVARWYEVETRSVALALEYEQSLAA